MAKLTINTGASDNDKSGDTLRTAFGKVNANFDELYAGGANETQLTNGSKTVTLGTDGNITLPDGGKINTYTSDGSVELQAGGLSGGSAGLVNHNYNNQVQVDDTGVYVMTNVLGPTAYNFIFGTDGTLNLPQSVSTGNAIIQTTSPINIQVNSNAHAWTFGADGSLTFPDTSVQTTAALPYVKSTFTGGTATLDIFTATWTNNGGGPIRLQISVSNTTDVTLQYTASSIVAGTTTSTNGGGVWTQHPNNPPFSSNNLGNLGDIQVMYLQDITNQKIYRITGMNTAGSVNPPHGAVLIERII